MPAKPFVKWVGGKGQLAKQILAVMPEKIQTYYEPFMGAGAIFFALAAEKRFEEAVLNDWNEELVNTYKIVRDSPKDLIETLKFPVNTPETFAAIRALDPLTLEPVFRAARFIYLNKTCFNGLYRVNKKGQFNTPYGRYPNPKICDEENLLACSEVLQGTFIFSGDFAGDIVALDAGPGDVVYFDPPYVPLSATANFASYTSDGFSIKDQIRLAAHFRHLVNQGVTVLLSNSDTEVVRKLYEGFEVMSIMARRNINSKGDRRGPVGEVLVIGRPETSEA